MTQKSIYKVYEQRLKSWSDIQAHLPKMFNEAHGNVLELGVRGGTEMTATVNARGMLSGSTGKEKTPKEG